MPAKRVLLYEDSRRRIYEGVRLFAKALAATYGPSGGKVLIERAWGPPRVTRDGFSVAKEIELEDAEPNLGVEILKDAVKKTHEEVGDGTTTTCLIASSLMEQGMRLVMVGYDPMGVARGIQKAAEAVEGELSKLAKAVRGRRQTAYVATVACAGDEELGEIIAKAIEEAGDGGMVVVEEGKSTKTSLKKVEGLMFDRGYLSPYFVTDRQNMECVLEDVLILLYEKKISNVEEFLPLLEKVAKSGKSFLVISEDVEGEALATLVVNKLKGNIKCCAVKAPGYGERRKRNLEDIAIVTGGRAFLEEMGIKLQDIGISDLGYASKVVVGREETTIIGGSGDRVAIESRMEQIREELLETDSDYDKEQLLKRLARLAGGVSLIEVGGATEVEVKYKKTVVEGAVSAVRAAQMEGIVAGGGVAFIRAASRARFKTDDEAEQVGAEALLKALEQPARQLIANAGEDPTAIITKIKEGKGNYGFEAKSRTLCDLFKAGVIDPVMVLKTALRNGVSAATMLLTTEASVTELPEEKKESETMPNLDDIDQF